MGKDREFNPKRLIESRSMIEKCMAEAMGLYTAKEPKHGDEWRDKSIWSNMKHAEHEFEEIKRSKDATRQLHNALDLCGQSAILAARIKEEMLAEGMKDSSYLLHTPKR